MEWRKWLTEGYGKRLKKLHAWNGWIILLLAITGIILYIPALRGPIASFRVGLKELHIILGIVSIILLLLYLPLMGKHLKQLVGKVNQRVNLSLVLFLLVGWSISGVILWQERNLPKAWSQTALFWHDLLTYVGVPYVIFHSISRSRWMRKEQAREQAAQREQMKIDRVNAAKMDETQRTGVGAKKEEETRTNGDRAAKEGQYAAVSAELTSSQAPESTESHTDRPNVLESLKKPLLSRRTFIQWVTGLLLVFAIGSSFFRWIKSVFDDGGTAIDKVAKEDGNEMSPDPIPLPDSNPPVGGGAQGNFRVYTVTPIPAFTSLDWEFVIGGLVTQPQQWTWDQFLQLPRKVQVSDFHCVTGWSVYQVTWEGIPLSKLLKLSGVDTKAKYVKFYSGDGVYTDALSLEQADMDDVMVGRYDGWEADPTKAWGSREASCPANVRL